MQCLELRAVFVQFQPGAHFDRAAGHFSVAPHGRARHGIAKNFSAANIDDLLVRLGANEFDLVAVGRALIVDPEWADKVREGRFSEILPFSREALKTLA